MFTRLRAFLTRRRPAPPNTPSEPVPQVVLDLRSLNQWPSGPRPYLKVIWPHCLLPEGDIRCERMRFGTSMERLLAYWAFEVFQSVEVLAFEEDGSNRAAIAHRRRNVRDAMELRAAVAGNMEDFPCRPV